MNQNIICWFEIYTEDIFRAKAFYTKVLGVTFEDAPHAPGESPEGMKMAFFSHPDNQGVNGALIQMPGGKPGNGLNTIVYFPCMDCAVETARVVEAGGQIQNPKFSIGTFGFCSICIDTEGNLFGLYSMQ